MSRFVISVSLFLSLIGGCLGQSINQISQIIYRLYDLPPNNFYQLNLNIEMSTMKNFIPMVYWEITNDNENRVGDELLGGVIIYLDAGRIDALSVKGSFVNDEYNIALQNRELAEETTLTYPKEINGKAIRFGPDQLDAIRSRALELKKIFEECLDIELNIKSIGFYSRSAKPKGTDQWVIMFVKNAVSKERSMNRESGNLIVSIEPFDGRVVLIRFRL